MSRSFKSSVDGSCGLMGLVIVLMLWVIATQASIPPEASISVLLMLHPRTKRNRDGAARMRIRFATVFYAENVLEIPTGARSAQQLEGPGGRKNSAKRPSAGRASLRGSAMHFLNSSHHNDVIQEMST